MKLIFVHGSGGMKEAFYFQTRRFSGSEAVDLPGHPEGQPCDTIEGYSDWLHGYFQQRGYQDVVLAGHSLGGGIALQHALKYPQDLKALILMGTGARLRVLPATLENLRQAVRDRAAWERNLTFGYDFLPLGQRTQARSKRLAIGPAVQLNDLLACDKFDVMDRLREIKLPTLAFTGSEDTQAPIHYTYYLGFALRGSRAYVIEGAGHSSFSDKPEEANALIASFLARLK